MGHGAVSGVETARDAGRHARLLASSRASGSISADLMQCGSPKSGVASFKALAD